MTAGLPVGHGQRRPGPPARRHRRSGRARSVVAHRHVRVRRVALRPVRAIRSASRRGSPAALVPMPLLRARRDPAGSQRGRPRDPVLRRRPDRRVPRHPRSRADRARRGRVALVAARASGARRSPTRQVTPRNLMGFKDGTNNIVVEDTARPRSSTCGSAPTDDPAWMRGGSYLVTRRIRMMLEIWDRSTLADQELTIGRDKVEGAPLGATKEHDAVDLTAKKRRRARHPGDRAHPARGARRRTTARACCAAASRSPTGSIRSPTSSTPGSSSSRTSAIRAPGSSRCSGTSRRTRSTSTSATTRAGRSRARPASSTGLR